MNVLLICPKYPPSYWTLQQSCEILGCKAFAPPLGLLTVAALLPKEWNLRLVDLNVRDLTDKDWDWSDLAAISGMVIQKEGVLASIQLAKKEGKLVAVGGPYPTSMPHEALEAGADFVVRGEGEGTVPLLVRAITQGDKKQVFQSESRVSMSSSPTPRFDLVGLTDYVTWSIQTSRGCPFNCEFCDVVSLLGRKSRYKPAEMVLTELRAIYSLGWRREIFICDDNFIGKRKDALDILRELIPFVKSLNYPFSFMTQASVELGRDPEIMALMVEANLTGVFVGIETLDKAVLAKAGKHQNIRSPLNESLIAMRRSGISVMGSFIMGLDGERPAADERVCRFVEDVSIPLVQVDVLRAVPGTNLWDRLDKEKRLVTQDIYVDEKEDRLNFVPSRPETDILREQEKAIAYLYDMPRLMARVYRHFLEMPPIRRKPFKENELGRHEDLKRRPPWRMVFREVPAFFRVVWRFGIRGSNVGQFWRQFLGMAVRNPTRLDSYLRHCIVGKDMHDLTRKRRKHIAASDTMG